MDRRTVLAGVASIGTVALAGCGSVINDITPGDDDEPEPSEYEITLISSSDELRDSAVVDVGEFNSYFMTVPFATEVSCTVDVTNGAPVTLLVMPENEFNRYRDDETFRAISDLSQQSRGLIDVSGQLASGTYHFVVEHSG